MQELGKALIIFGVILLGLGLAFTFANKIPYWQAAGGYFNPKEEF